MLKVYVSRKPAGTLYRSHLDDSKYRFGYHDDCPAERVVSLTMPVIPDQYESDHSVLHPIFDMNIPEGALADRLRQAFSKVIPNFDAMALLSIVGRSQIGRLSFSAPGEDAPEIPTENLNNILVHDGAEGLFDSLLTRYAVHSGISGAMPKVMVRSDDPSRVTHRGMTHIVKAWSEEYPRLAENEYFCMRAAKHAGLDVPHSELSKEGKFLVIERFDFRDGQYLGFEDFCVLNAKTSHSKYDGSYESIAKRIKQFVSHEEQTKSLESYFRSLVLSCALRNGDAHLKNFGLLYGDINSSVTLSPTYDVVTTTVYHQEDMLALTLGGTKRWPKHKALLDFALKQLNYSNEKARTIIGEVSEGIHFAADELLIYMDDNAAFRPIGTKMLNEWSKGIEHSLNGTPLFVPQHEDDHDMEP